MCHFNKKNHASHSWGITIFVGPTKILSFLPFLGIGSSPVWLSTVIPPAPNFSRSINLTAKGKMPKLIKCILDFLPLSYSFSSFVCYWTHFALKSGFSWLCSFFLLSNLNLSNSVIIYKRIIAFYQSSSL
jgi:hypothetical protein